MTVTPDTHSLPTVRKGRSLPFLFDRDGESITGWTCTIKVQQHPGDTPSISRVIPANGLGWSGFLTSTETAALSELGTWKIIGELHNASEDRREFPDIRFHLSEAP